MCPHSYADADKTLTAHLRICSRSVIMEDYRAASTQLGVGDGGEHELRADVEENWIWDHVWLDAVIGVVAGHHEKVPSFPFFLRYPALQRDPGVFPNNDHAFCPCESVGS